MIRLEQVWKSSLQYVLKTSSKRLEDVLKTFLRDVLKTFWRRLEDALKTSWRRLETYGLDGCIGLDEDVLWRCITKANIFVLIKMSWRLRRKTFSRRLHQDECLLGSIIIIIIKIIFVLVVVMLQNGQVIVIYFVCCWYSWGIPSRFGIKPEQSTWY